MAGLFGIQEPHKQRLTSGRCRICRERNVYVRRLLLSRQRTPISVTGKSVPRLHGR